MADHGPRFGEWCDLLFSWELLPYASDEFAQDVYIQLGSICCLHSELGYPLHHSDAWHLCKNVWGRSSPVQALSTRLKWQPDTKLDFNTVSCLTCGHFIADFKKVLPPQIYQCYDLPLWKPNQCCSAIYNWTSWYAFKETGKHETTRYRERSNKYWTQNPCASLVPLHCSLFFRAVLSNASIKKLAEVAVTMQVWLPVS